MKRTTDNHMARQKQRVAKLETQAALQEKQIVVMGHMFTTSSFRSLMKSIAGKSRGLPNACGERST
jgi:uncharacterized coiled-coil protein SlyX